MDFVFNDGGRKESGRKGFTGDCVCRAIAIVTGLPYKDVYDTLAKGNATQRKSSRTPKKGRTASHGINVRRKWFGEYMTKLGFVWVPTMQIGSGCTVHLRKDELPVGKMVVSLSKHYTAVVDGVIHDTYDPSRGETRCVYGYWLFPSSNTRMQVNAISNDGRKTFMEGVYKRITGKISPFEIAILKELWNSKPNFDELIDTLKSQGNDNPQVMEEVCGQELFELLKTL